MFICISIIRSINPSTGVITRNSNEANENDFAELTVVIKQISKTNGDERPDITLKSTVYFYERLAKIGDIVFNDGSYSDELDPTKTPIGVCFYIDPLTDDEKNNGLKQSSRRLMCSCEPIYFSNYLCWGYTAGSVGYNNMYVGPSPITIDNSIWIGDINKLTNTTEYLNINEANLFSDDVYRDNNNINTNKFKTFNNNHVFGNIGWINASNNVIVDKLKLSNGEYKTINITKLDDFIPAGYYNTLAIIEQRNKLLDNLYKVNNPGSSNEEIIFERPSDFGNTTEYNYLTTLLNKADEWLYEDWTNQSIASISGTNGNAIYYPAASYCFAYQPNVPNLSDKFKKYNWFLPSSGELARILYYIYQSLDRNNNGTALQTPNNSNYGLENSNEAANAFYNIFKLDKFNKTNILNSNNLYFSSDENSSNMSIMLNCYGKTNKIVKYTEGTSSNRYIIIPVCMF